jgi:hypothetical protein
MYQFAHLSLMTLTLPVAVLLTFILFIQEAAYCKFLADVNVLDNLLILLFEINKVLPEGLLLCIY